MTNTRIACGLFIMDEFDETDEPIDELIEMPIDGILDLHTFQPRDVKDLVPDYLDECRKRGIPRVRIIHGKGRGVLLKTVHGILRRLPQVVSFQRAGEEEGGWGATIVELKPWDEPPSGPDVA